MRGHRIGRRRRSPILAILAVLGLLGLASAPAGAAPKVIAPAGAALQLEVSKGRLIRLDQPATSVFVADPDIADVQVKSPSLVYVFGKAAGETTLYAVGDGDQVLLNATVVVRHNIQRLQEAIHELDPRSAVSVSTVDDQLVLEGTVFSAS
ncbi:MAG: pilus assembly protein N-terminal domain-containing protein, partial [Stellaceae bacterium]